MTSHFFKTLIVFIGMIVLGLIGVFLTSFLSEGEQVTNGISNTTSVAK